ncbi:OmpA family protein [Vannielia litorea]|uniref:OmpA-OmpF porin, OOP family n=1 Tax=Vannielia litorea TaxID=1217970 RepID=A0A1N6H1Q2_9RHOB|nr:OmpA family protein [Vannielia litorea]SIO13724.1 OmpA-OmpF porin, OOP family [Vannielia litorea]
MNLRTALLAAAFLTPITMAGASGADALKLEFPAGARQTAEQVETLGSYRLPISPFRNGDMQSVWAEGQVRQQAWQVQARGMTTLQLLAPLRAQVEASGFEVIFECEARECGGFDFRYATENLPEPDMHVDLGDYRFMAAHRMGEEKPEYVAFLVSRSAGRGFVQITRVGPEEAEADVLVASTKTPDLGESLIDEGDEDDLAGPLLGFSTPSTTVMPLTQQLEIHGRAVLEDLAFATGSSQLEVGEYTSLDLLAGYLKTHPERSVVLVGHTDAEGSLAGNIALSKKRAGAVEARLTALGVPASQIKAEGVGFLSPITSNLTEEGREANRRVEAILSSTE